MDKLTELKTAVRKAKLALEDADAALRAHVIDTYPIKPGDILESIQGVRAQVTRIGTNYDGNPTISGLLLNKDGKPGKRLIAPWDGRRWKTATVVDHIPLTGTEG